MAPEPSTSTSPPANISLTIAFRGISHAITLPSDASLFQLFSSIEDSTDVPPSLQKILFKGKKLVWEDEEVAQQKRLDEVVGLKDGTKLQVLGSTLKEVEGVRKEEAEHMRKERIMRERALKAPVKLRSTGSSTGPTSSSSPSLKYRFHALQPLQHLPSPTSALQLLQKLSKDPAIQHIMQKHQFAVGLLTELAPHEHPELLGLNENKGQAIKLRLRTNRYDGFRTYKEVRMVLCHELAHNVWSDHDENFKQLNSQLNREVAEYEKLVAQSTHSLSGVSSRDQYQPPSELEDETQTFVLGGSNSRNPGVETQEERRKKVLEATMNRLRNLEEDEIEHSCRIEKK